MKYNRLTRRHFLQGAGGSFLALPFLPSLMSKAEAQTLPIKKFMVMFWSGHGGLHFSNLYPFMNNPTVSQALTETMLYNPASPTLARPAHAIRRGSLTSMKTTRASNLSIFRSLPHHRPGEYGASDQPEGYGLDPASLADLDSGQARVSPLLGSFISDTILQKMNLISGLDMMHPAGHNVGQMGNFGGGGGTVIPKIHNSTIDYVIGNHAPFYGTEVPAARSMVLDIGAGVDNLSVEQTAFGILENPNKARTLGEAFYMLFGGLQGGPKTNWLLGKVKDDYARLTNSPYGPGRRISSEDKGRLQQFWDTLNTLVEVINRPYPSGFTPPVIPSNYQDRQVISGDTDVPVDLASNETVFDYYMQLITAAFQSGRCNMFVVTTPSNRDQYFNHLQSNRTFTDHGQPFPLDGGGWAIDNRDTHQGINHCHRLANRQRYMIRSARWFFEKGFYNLARKLNAVQYAGGGTYLDQSLLMWTQESGYSTHDSQCLPMVTAGSAGGYLQTGQYLDYRNLTRNAGLMFVGIPYNRFMGTVLQAMGVPRENYEFPVSHFPGSPGRIPHVVRNNVAYIPGYGHPCQGLYEVNGQRIYPYDYQLDDMGDPLPFMRRVA